MTNRDWFRKETWSSDDQADFEARLGRARAYSRPQYLRIQAITLLETDRAYAPSVAVLLDRVIDGYPDSIDFVMGLKMKGECLEAMGDIPGALGFYLRAIEATRKFPSIETDAWLSFVWLVARSRMRDRYAFATELLDEFAEQGIAFPIRVFRIMSSRAFMLSDCGKRDAAISFARSALAAASQSTSGLSRHPDVGLVGDIEPEVSERLIRLAGA